MLAGILQLGDKVLHNHFGTPTMVTITSLFGKSAQDPERGNGWFLVKGILGYEYMIDGRDGMWDTGDDFITDTTEVTAQLAPRDIRGWTEETRWEAGSFERNMDGEAQREAEERG